MTDAHVTNWVVQQQQQQNSTRSASSAAGSTTTKKLFVCFTNSPHAIHKKAVALVERGGVYTVNPQMTTGTSVLVVFRVGSTKHEEALRHRSIRVVTDKWITLGNASEETIDNFPCGRFYGLKFCTTGFVDSNRLDDFNTLRRFIEHRGGVLDSDLSLDTDCLVCTKEVETTGSEKLQQASVWQIPKVNFEDFIENGDAYDIQTLMSRSASSRQRESESVPAEYVSVARRRLRLENQNQNQQVIIPNSTRSSTNVAVPPHNNNNQVLLVDTSNDAALQQQSNADSSSSSNIPSNGDSSNQQQNANKAQLYESAQKSGFHFPDAASVRKSANPAPPKTKLLRRSSTGATTAGTAPQQNNQNPLSNPSNQGASIVTVPVPPQPPRAPPPLRAGSEFVSSIMSQPPNLYYPRPEAKVDGFTSTAVIAYFVPKSRITPEVEESIRNYVAKGTIRRSSVFTASVTHIVVVDPKIDLVQLTLEIDKILLGSKSDQHHQPAHNPSIAVNKTNFTNSQNSHCNAWPIEFPITAIDIENLRFIPNQVRINNRIYVSKILEKHSATVASPSAAREAYTQSQRELESKTKDSAVPATASSTRELDKHGKPKPPPSVTALQLEIPKLTDRHSPSAHLERIKSLTPPNSSPEVFERERISRIPVVSFTWVEECYKAGNVILEETNYPAPLPRLPVISFCFMDEKYMQKLGERIQYTLGAVYQPAFVIGRSSTDLSERNLNLGADLTFNTHLVLGWKKEQQDIMRNARQTYGYSSDGHNHHIVKNYIDELDRLCVYSDKTWSFCSRVWKIRTGRVDRHQINCNLVTEEWIRECLLQKHWVNPVPYEIWIPGFWDIGRPNSTLLWLKTLQPTDRETILVANRHDQGTAWWDWFDKLKACDESNKTQPTTTAPTSSEDGASILPGSSLNNNISVNLRQAILNLRSNGNHVFWCTREELEKEKAVRAKAEREQAQQKEAERLAKEQREREKKQQREEEKKRQLLLEQSEQEEAQKRKQQQRNAAVAAQSELVPGLSPARAAHQQLQTTSFLAESSSKTGSRRSSVGNNAMNIVDEDDASFQIPGDTTTTTITHATAGGDDAAQQSLRLFGESAVLNNSQSSNSSILIRGDFNPVAAATNTNNNNNNNNTSTTSIFIIAALSSSQNDEGDDAAAGNDVVAPNPTSSSASQQQQALQTSSSDFNWEEMERGSSSFSQQPNNNFSQQQHPHHQHSAFASSSSMQMQSSQIHDPGNFERLLANASTDFIMMERESSSNLVEGNKNKKQNDGDNDDDDYEGEGDDEENGDYLDEYDGDDDGDNENGRRSSNYMQSQAVAFNHKKLNNRSHILAERSQSMSRKRGGKQNEMNAASNKNNNQHTIIDVDDSDSQPVQNNNNTNAAAAAAEAKILSRFKNVTPTERYFYFCLNCWKCAEMELFALPHVNASIQQQIAAARTAATTTAVANDKTPPQTDWDKKEQMIRWNTIRDFIIPLIKEKLNAVVVDTPTEATHVITGEPLRTEIQIVAVALGKWMLHPSYILQSLQAQSFMNEVMFEWNEDSEMMKEGMNGPDRTSRKTSLIKSYFFACRFQRMRQQEANNMNFVLIKERREKKMQDEMRQQAAKNLLLNNNKQDSAPAAPADNNDGKASNNNNDDMVWDIEPEIIRSLRPYYGWRVAFVGRDLKKSMQFGKVVQIGGGAVTNPHFILLNNHKPPKRFENGVPVTEIFDFPTLSVPSWKKLLDDEKTLQQAQLTHVFYFPDEDLWNEKIPPPEPSNKDGSEETRKKLLDDISVFLKQKPIIETTKQEILKMKQKYGFMVLEIGQLVGWLSVETRATTKQQPTTTRQQQQLLPVPIEIWNRDVEKKFPAIRQRQ